MNAQMTAQELREQAQKVLQQAEEMEQEAKRKEREEKAKAEREARDLIIKNVCANIVNELVADKVKATVQQCEGWQRYRVNLNPDVQIEVTVNTNLYNGQVCGVSVKVGEYGSHPQTYKSVDWANLPYDKIVTSIIRRQGKKALKQQQWDKQQQETQHKLKLEERNKPEAQRIQKLVPDNLNYNVRVLPSPYEAGKVYVKVDRQVTLTPEAAEELVKGLVKLLSQPLVGR